MWEKSMSIEGGSGLWPVTVTRCPAGLSDDLLWEPVKCRGQWGLIAGNPRARAFPGDSVKNLPANAGGVGSIPGSGMATGEGNGNPLQCSCLENPTDRGACWAAVHSITKSQTQLSRQPPTTNPRATYSRVSLRG